MNESDGILEIEQAFTDADQEKFMSAMATLDQKALVCPISNAIVEGVEKAERAAFGGIVFRGRQKAWGNYITFVVYFMIGEAYRILKPNLEPWLGKKIVIGMAKNEVHNIGKNSVSALAAIAGFEVFDLGIDVPPLTFIEKVKEVDADVLCISSLYSNGFENVVETIEMLANEGLEKRVMVQVGGSMTKEMADEWGADAYGQCVSLSINCLKQMLGIETFPDDRLGEGIIKREIV